jgi:hypothetical protein
MYLNTPFAIVVTRRTTRRNKEGSRVTTFLLVRIKNWWDKEGDHGTSKVGNNAHPNRVDCFCRIPLDMMLRERALTYVYLQSGTDPYMRGELPHL